MLENIFEIRKDEIYLSSRTKLSKRKEKKKNLGSKNDL